ncbi:MAG: CapA family protein [Pseudomonadota bacterium]
MSIQRATGLAIAALLIAGCSVTPPSDTAPEAPTPVEPAVVPETQDTALVPPPPDRSSQRLTIAAVGDMMIGTDYPDNRLPDDDAVNFLAAVAPTLGAADIAFGNLEGVLMDGGEPAKQCSNPRACYLFRSPTRYARLFAEAGFDVMSLANNHARDFGEEGRTSSMMALAAQGIHHSGRVGDIASWTVDDLDIAMIAFAVTRNSNMMLDIVASAVSVATLAADHDIVIVSFHGGAEGLDALHIPFAEETYYNEPRGDVVAFARAMVDSGADLVIGHGPHVVRGMEHYRGRLIAYSLGNFATYYGISVVGLKGVAPILTTTVDGNGRFVSGQIHSTHQVRPGGPIFDPDQRALHTIRRLSMADFSDPGIQFSADGSIAPAPRGYLRQHDQSAMQSGAPGEAL